MTKKTAMQELLEDLISDRDSEVLGIAKQAIQECIITVTSYLETEKQQIIEAHKKGQLWNKSGYNLDECEQYYNETYNQ